MKTNKIFRFTLVLKNVNKHTPDLEDSLYEAGCDDALIHFRNGTVYLNFDREAGSLEQAVITAIKNVKSSSVDPEIASVAPENLVTEAEIAKRLEVSRQTVSLWIRGERRKFFPHPVMRLTEKSPLWKWSDVAHWLYENKIINDKSIVEEALFFSHINSVLEECDTKIRKIRSRLLQKLSSPH